jgi:DNA-binding protein HU-beta
MTKAELITSISEGSGISKKDVTLVLDRFAATVENEVWKQGDKLTYPGLGTFSVRAVAAKVGRNPKTGASIQIPAKNKLAFKASPNLK